MEEPTSLEYKPTWVVAAVCFVIILISLFAERGLNYLGKCLRHHDQDALFEALQKLKAELMLLGFISLLLNVFQGVIRRICISPHLDYTMLPCKRQNESNTDQDYLLRAINNGRRLLSADSSSEHCSRQGKVPLLSTESFHQLHIFVFVVAVVHVVSSAIILVLGGARIRQWKPWEDSISKVEKGIAEESHSNHLLRVLQKHAWGYWRKAAVISWIKSLFRQFYSSVTESEYIALREGFIMRHCRGHHFDFHKYMMLSVEKDFKQVVGISWYQWLFVVVFLTLNVEGWHTYFWLSFLPVILLLLVGAKLEHIIVRLAQNVDELKKPPGQQAKVKPSDEYFWFNKPRLVLHVIHFVLFQNAFEIAFFFWILFTFGYHSCIMERKRYLITRLIMGVVVQVLCSYITLPLYALVSKMGNSFDRVDSKAFARSRTITFHNLNEADRKAKLVGEARLVEIETD